MGLVGWTLGGYVVRAADRIGLLWFLNETCLCKCSLCLSDIWLSYKHGCIVLTLGGMHSIIGFHIIITVGNYNSVASSTHIY